MCRYRAIHANTIVLTSDYRVNPIYYVGFSTATLVASLIMFQGFNTDDPAKAISLLAGFLITFLGVHLLEISRKPAMPAAPGHSALEGGLMNPRLSIQGRMSIDGWNGAAGTPMGGAIHGHARRTSGHRAQTIFHALEEDEDDGLALDRLPEAENEYDDEIDERTHLQSDGRRSASPRIAASGSQGDHRRPPL